MTRLALLSVLILGACRSASTGPYYMDARDLYDANAITYAVARDDVALKQGACSDQPATACVVTDEQWQRWHRIRFEVETADAPMRAALTAWHDSRKRPANLDALATALTAAQQKMIALREEIR